MKQADIIRLGVIAIALLLAYNGIIHLIEFIDVLIGMIISSYPEEVRGLTIGLKVIGYFVFSWLLMKNSRKISNYIDDQK